MRKLNIFLCVCCVALVSYAASILENTTAEADARLIRFDGEPDIAGAKLTRGWPWVAAEAASANAVKELVWALNSVSSYSNPKANSATYTGTWAHSSVYALDENQRGEWSRGCTIIQTLTKVNAITTITSLSNVASRVMQTHEILKIFSLEEGEGEWLAYQWNNLSTASRIACMETLTEANLETLVPARWAFSQRDWKEQADNTAQFTVAWRTRTWTNSVGSGTNKVLRDTNVYANVNFNPRTGMAGITRQKVDGANGVPSDDAETIRDAISVEAGFAVDSVRISDNQDGSVNLRRTQTKARSTNDYTVTTLYSDQGTSYEERQVVEWKWLSSSDATVVYNNAVTYEDAATNAFPAAPAAHVLRYVNKTPRDNGLVDVTRETRKPASTTSANDWNDKTNFNQTVTFQTRHTRVDGDEVAQIRWFTNNWYFMRTVSQDTAYKWANGTSLPHSTNINPVRSHARYNGKDRWEAWALTQGCGEWVSEGGSGPEGAAHPDLGSGQ